MEVTMITQIWFDFGNIFIPIFPQRTREKMEDCGVQLSPEAFDALNVEFEKGLISGAEFLRSPILAPSRSISMWYDSFLAYSSQQPMLPTSEA